MRQVVSFNKEALKELNLTIDKNKTWYNIKISQEIWLDIDTSKKKLMRLSKSDLCDIIINCYLLETQETVKDYVKSRFAMLWM